MVKYFGCLEWLHVLFTDIGVNGCNIGKIQNKIKVMKQLINTNLVLYLFLILTK